MEHTGIKTQLKRYYRWRFSGPITVITIFAIGFLAWHYMTENIIFFDKFTCPETLDYYKDEHRRQDVPKYSELTEEQKIKYDLQVQDCINQGWKKTGS